MRFRKGLSAVLMAGVLICALAPCPVVGDEESVAGRKIVASWQDAVVTIQLVLKTSMSWDGDEGMQRESKSDTTGVIIDASGLIVTSLSSTSPSDILEGIMSDEDGSFGMRSEVADVKILLADGREIPAKIVLRDKDLDLAFIRPKEPLAQPLAAVDFSKATNLTVLDQMVMLHRLGTVASRSIGVCLDRVQAVVERPRTFYVLGTQCSTASLGSPVFALDGNPAGLLVLRTVPTSSDMSFLSMADMGIMYIVLPAADIIEVAQQAPQDAPEES